MNSILGSQIFGQHFRNKTDILFDVVRHGAFGKKMLLPHLSIPLSFSFLRNVFPDSLFALCEHSVSLWSHTSFVSPGIRETLEIKIISGH